MSLDWTRASVSKSHHASKAGPLVRSTCWPNLDHMSIYQMSGNKERETLLFFLDGKKALHLIHNSHHGIFFRNRKKGWMLDRKWKACAKHLLRNLQNGYRYSHFIGMKTEAQRSNFIRWFREFKHLQSFIHQIFVEYLLCVRYSSRCWGFSCEQNRQESLPSCSVHVCVCCGW